ncbi:MAG TPA: TIGR04551 family protein [Polyangiaceae bacterium]|nr:TIGR04551 family protein [Polyangiaceae bacterium]
MSPTGINPSRDQQELGSQGAQRPATGDLPSQPQEVFSDDWWGRARPVIELHGYFRTRAELFHNFFLGRHSSINQGNDPQYLWPLPLDQSYGTLTGNAYTAGVCGPGGNQACYDKTESGANVRLRFDPEIHISDNLRIVTQIDALDNLVLGSTPDAYAMQPSSTNPRGYTSTGANPYAPIGFLTTTQGPPTAGVNGWSNSINVKRAWGEYMTPLGQLRFGRMPGQWGLGMVENSGDGIDSDYQTTLDRIMFITGIKSIDLYFGGAWDFVSTGPTNANAFDVYGGQPYNTCNLCNVNEWAAFVARRLTAEQQKLTLAHGDIALNGGLYAKLRSQNIDISTQTPNTPQTDVTSNTSGSTQNGLEPRQAWAFTPDLWVQALWRKLRVEAEAAVVYGQIGYSQINQDVTHPVDVLQFGVATQTEFRAVDDKLDLKFGFGWASGDEWANNPGPGGNPVGALQPYAGGLRPGQEFNTFGPLSTFAFHPDYRVDLIFYRNILSRVEGSYYFRPSVDYDFLRHADGEKFGGGAAVIWSRASEFVQAPGHKRDLGVELDLQLYYQSKDGSLNDDPSKIGGFYTMLQYGVFFPLGGLDYLPDQNPQNIDAGLSAAQIVRLFLGIVY